MSFSHKKINPSGFKEQSKDIFIQTIRKTSLGIILTTIGFFLLYTNGFLSSTVQNIQEVKKNIISNASSTIAKTVGQEMGKDEYGNINILLVGYGGENHAGGYLADSIIVVSFDPKNNSAVFLSIPRDLIVNMNGYVNKVNSVLAYKYNKTNDLDESALALAEKAGEITNIDIPYYALIDFSGFSRIIDDIGGIQVDVPNRIYDRSYPGPNWSYTTFRIEKGLQELDGETALKYARSRYSSSDFSRSQRQQLIIKSIIQKLLDKGTLSLSNIKKLYNNYTEMVTTNISLDEMIGLGQYTKNIPLIHSFGYTMECRNTIWKTMQAGCVLYPANSEDFNGMAGLLPTGASKNKISNYKYTSYIGSLLSHNQEYLNEQIGIEIYNATDKEYARKFPYRNILAGKLASKLKRNGFLVNKVDNADITYTGTQAIIYSEKEVPETIRMLRLYTDINNIEYKPTSSLGTGENTGSHIELYLGNDYLDRVGNKPFNYYN